MATLKKDNNGKNNNNNNNNNNYNNNNNNNNSLKHSMDQNSKTTRNNHHDSYSSNNLSCKQSIVNFSSNSDVSSSSSIGGCSFYAGLFTDQGNIKTDNQDIIMYDRIPRYNHDDIELPSKLEWFVCPEGPKTVESMKR